MHFSHGNIFLQFSSVQFSRSVMSDSLRPHESQHARPPRPSPGVQSDSNYVNVLKKKKKKKVRICLEIYPSSRFWSTVLWPGMAQLVPMLSQNECCW